MSRPYFGTRIRTEEDKKVFFAHPVSLPILNLGNFTLQTTESGSIESKPVSAPAEQEPADVIQPASLELSSDRLELKASAEFSGAVLLESLMSNLLDIEINILPGIRMPIRSFLGSLFASVEGVKGEVLDISGTRLPALVTEQLSNSALDAAREAAQALLDAAQDAATAQAALEASTVASDISGAVARISALEAGVGAVDLSGVLVRLDDAESQIFNLINGKLDIALYEGEKPQFATAGDVANLDVRVGGAESTINANSDRLDALEAAVPSKVAQADYDVYVASNDAAVAAAASAASTAQSAADAASALASAAEIKGLLSKLEVEDNSTENISEVYWSETQGSVLAGIMDSGKIASYMFSAPHAELTIPATVGGSAAAAGAVRRLRNAHPTAVLPISLESVSYEVAPQETAIFQHNGTAWRLL
jgi:hypothetical protein